MLGHEFGLLTTAHNPDSQQAWKLWQKIVNPIFLTNSLL